MAFIPSISLFPSSLFPLLNSKPCRLFTPLNLPPPIASSLAVPTILYPKGARHYHNPPYEFHLRTARIGRICSIPEDFLLSEANPVENSQDIVSTSDDGGANIISVLLFIAFIGLSILTIGVIYIAVADFLQKREREKFEKEEAGNKKKSGKKGKVGTRARAGPRGFGQKIDEVDDDY